MDAAEHETADRLQRVLLEELHHRIKNTLATVMAIASQSLRNADTLEHGIEAVSNRLHALGRAHDLLLRESWTSASLDDVLKHAIEPFVTEGADPFLIQTSTITVDRATILPLAMVLNELCTNALKYGALSTPAGRVTIAASVDDTGKLLHLTWTESDGPVVKPPSRRSFGSRLIERSLFNNPPGQAELTFPPTGVVCSLKIPLERG